MEGKSPQLVVLSLLGPWRQRPSMVVNDLLNSIAQATQLQPPGQRLKVAPAVRKWVRLLTFKVVDLVQSC
jgi:hypothetical protein